MSERVYVTADAIEAAHKAWREQARQDGAIFEYNLRAALEAAAPHLMAKAWAEGHEVGFWNGRLSQLNVPYDAPDPLIGKAHEEATNPYREGAGDE